MLDGQLDVVRNLFFDLGRRGAGIGGDDQGVFDRKLRILKAAHALERLKPTQQKRNAQHNRDHSITEREFGDFHPVPTPSPV